MGRVWDEPHVADRFWSLVDRSGECWRWQGYIGPQGYGRLGVNGQYEYAHRVAWELTHGHVPAGMQVVGRPECPNRDCVRPDHLELARHSLRPHNTLDDLDALIDRSGGEDACWRWQGSLNSTDQPTIMVSRKVIRVHRYMYATANGVELRPYETIFHRCGTATCVNPRHLYRASENAHLDVVRRPMVDGRKLSDEERATIIHERDQGTSVRDLARRYGVSRVTVYNVLKRP